MINLPLPLGSESCNPKLLFPLLPETTGIISPLHCGLLKNYPWHKSDVNKDLSLLFFFNHNIATIQRGPLGSVIFTKVLNSIACFQRIMCSLIDLNKMSSKISVFEMLYLFLFHVCVSTWKPSYIHAKGMLHLNKGWASEPICTRALEIIDISFSLLSSFLPIT